MKINSINNLPFLRFGRQIPISELEQKYIDQLPVKGKFITSAEEEGDTLEITQADNITKFVMTFKDGKKFSLMESYNHKSHTITYYDEDGNTVKVDRIGDENEGEEFVKI